MTVTNTPANTENFPTVIPKTIPQLTTSGSLVPLPPSTQLPSTTQPLLPAQKLTSSGIEVPLTVPSKVGTDNHEESDGYIELHNHFSGVLPPNKLIELSSGGNEGQF